MSGRRAQVTVFIIIGIIALIGLGTFLYMRAAVVPSEIGGRPVIEEVPTEAKPMNDFVQNCLYITAKDGLDLIGVHGGYISSEKVGSKYNPYNPTDGEAVEMFPGSGIIVPYWIYLSSRNDCDLSGTCAFSSKRPSLYKSQGEPSIEGQLEDYIDQNIRICLNNLDDFRAEGYTVEELGSPRTEVTVTEESVAFYLEYPLRATRDDVSFEISKYFEDMPVHMKQVYELATDIANVQANGSFLEMAFLNILPLYSEMDRSALPPLRDGSTGTSSGEFWVKTEVKEMIKQMLTGLHPLIRVLGTSNFALLGATGNEQNENLLRTVSIYKNRATIVPLRKVNYGMNAAFTYLPIWEPYFQLICVGSSGEVCRPQSYSVNLALFQVGFHEYRNYYFLSYPVLVELTDTLAYSGARPYTFNFFIESNIRKNQPLTSGFKLGVASSTGVAPQFCKESLWDGPNMTVRVYDYSTEKPIAGAEIFYTCGSQSCVIGTTGQDGKLTKHFPRCIGGTVGASKKGYLGKRVAATTDTEDAALERSVYLYPSKVMDVMVSKIQLTRPETGGSWVPSGTSSVGLGMQEEAIVMLERIGDDGGDEHTIVAEYCPDERKDCDYTSRVVYPGRYSARVILITRKSFQIMPQKRCEGEDTLFTDEECFYIPENPISFGEEAPFVIGGVEDFEIEISSADLRESKIMNIKALGFGVDKLASPVIEDIIAPTSDLAVYQNALRSMLEPTFSR